jgi:hypothetical protein
MDLSPAGMPQITDDHVIADGPRVRALVIHRLEMVWKACAPHLDAEGMAERGERPDPRMVQIAFNTCRELTDQYRLKKPSVPTDDESVEGADEARTRALVTAALDELEAAREGR